MMDPRTTKEARALTIVEALCVLAVATIAAAIALPVLGGQRSLSWTTVSTSNLMTLGAAYVVYAADWNGRQITVIDDEISSYGDNANQAFPQFALANGPHPPIWLGWGCLPGGGCGLWRYSMTLGFSGNFPLAQPITFDGSLAGVGSFRMHNTRPLHDYVNGRYYDPVFYPPTDPVEHAIVEPAFDLPWEWVFLDGLDQSHGDIPAWGSYCPSPAAMFHPDVMRAPSAGGWQDPWSIDDGFASPGLFEATYPALKTMLIEHNWNQNAPADRCNPAFDPGTFGGCEPYYFNQGQASSPVTLFYDLSVRELPNAEVLAADAFLMRQTGEGLWSRDTPFGKSGYFGDEGYDLFSLSHHVLTTDGILGRDTVIVPPATLNR